MILEGITKESRRHGGQHHPLVQEGAAAPRQPVSEGLYPRSRHPTLRLHPGPLVRRVLQCGHQQVEVRGGTGLSIYSDIPLPLI